MPEPRSIWIDLDNSPHVPLFLPIIRHYREKGVEVVLTARDHPQTIELLELAGLGGTYFTIGRHSGKSKIKKLIGTFQRALDLSFVKEADIAVAISHGSRAMTLAAVGLRIPVVTMYDYEFTETFFFHRMSDVIVIPDALPTPKIRTLGLRSSMRRIEKYVGIKEELYVNYFVPRPDFRDELLDEHGVQNGDNVILALLRPPATTANYHSENSDALLDEVLGLLTHALKVVTVIVSRTSDQRVEIRKKLLNNPEAEGRVILLEESVDGLQLAHAADLVISGGGTMNREAVLLGVPVYSIFAGRQGALDRQMEADGKIVFIRDANDFSKIELKRRERTAVAPLTDRVERFVIEQIDAFL